MKILVKNETENIIRILFEQNKVLNLSNTDIYSLGKALFILDNFDKILNNGTIELVFSRTECQDLMVCKFTYYLTISKFGINIRQNYNEDYGFGSDHFNENKVLVNNQILKEIEEYNDDDKIQTQKDFVKYFNDISNIIFGKPIYQKEIRETKLSIKCDIDNFKLHK